MTGRVLLLSTLFPPDTVGGAEIVVEQLARGLVADGAECHVIALTNESSVRRETVDGIEVTRLPLCNLYWPYDGHDRPAAMRTRWHVRDTWNRPAAAAVGRELDRIRPDVVHTHNLSGFSISVWAEAGTRRIPLVHTLHDHYLLCPRTTMFRDGRNCERQCLQCRVLGAPRRTQRDRPDVVTGPSTFIVDRHLSHGWFLDIDRRVVPNAVSASAPLRRRRTDGPIRFGFLGRIAETKGIDRLVDAFLRLDRPDTELLIAGTGEPALEHALRTRTAHRSSVSWLGFVDPADLLSEIDVLVVPSLWEEPFGLVVLEAFGFGVPVIGAARGGIPELIAEGAGWVVDPDDTEALTAALAARCRDRDELRPLADACFDAAARHSIDRMRAGYLDAYRLAGFSLR